MPDGHFFRRKLEISALGLNIRSNIPSKPQGGTLVNWPFFLPENAFASKCLKRGLFNSIRNGFLLVHYHRKSLRRMPETQLHTRKIDFWARKVVKKCLFRGIFGHIWQNGLLECYRVSKIMKKSTKSNEISPGKHLKWLLMCD